MEELDSREHSTNMRRKAVNRTFEKLLEFSFHDHFLLMQDSADIRECGKQLCGGSGRLERTETLLCGRTASGHRHRIHAPAGKGAAAV